ncbi:MAG: DeoR/GlpR transcriptional regulator [Oceanospirillaceae bacterium]|nr:DeoR/GlpR transcriptional regulator [Oceanospirillaceae bacterium]
MKLHRRQDAILSVLQARGSCSIIELAEMLEVSDETIRRNVRPLIEKKFLQKVHGGVILAPRGEDEQPFGRRMQSNAPEKEQIGALLAGIIANGDSLMIDTGSTTAYVARALRGHKDLSVVTNCTEIARTLVMGQGNQVHLAGGQLRRDDSAVFGHCALTFVSQFQVKYAVLSIAAISLQGQFMDHHMLEAEFSRAMIAQAQQTIIVADSSKFGSHALIQACSLSQVDILISNQAPPADLCALLEQYEVRLILP